MIFQRQRSAFSMITAIFLILIMASLLALVSSLSGHITKQTTNFYRKEQAALLAKSYTEYAILAIQGHNLSSNACLRTINSITDLNGGATTANINKGSGYHVEVKIQYIGMPASVSCTATTASTFGHKSLGRQETVANDTTTNHLYATIDVYVMYRDTDYFDSVISGSRWSTYHRRTVQKL